jgi:hypothetical protein
MLGNLLDWQRFVSLNPDEFKLKIIYGCLPELVYLYANLCLGEGGSDEGVVSS